LIIVAMRRNAANERPSIRLLIADDVVGAGGQKKCQGRRCPESSMRPLRPDGYRFLAARE
jgi:hypothetical protein